MKNILCLLGLLLFCMPSRAQTEFTRSQDWEAIKSQAKKVQKLIFVDAYTDWCGWCKVMDNETFSNAAVGSIMGRHFVNVKLEMEKDELGKKLSTKYAISSFPTYLIFNWDGELVYTLVGFQKPGDFTQSLMKIINPVNHISSPGFDAKLDHTYPDFYVDAIIPKKGKKKFPKAEQTNAWLDKNTDWTNEVNWVVFKRFVHDANELHRTRFWENYGLLDSLYGKDMVKDVASTILTLETTQMAENKEAKGFEKLLSERLLLMGEGEETALLYRVYFYKKAQLWSDLNVILSKEYKKNGVGNVEWWNEQCWDIYEHCPDTVLIKSALIWIDDVCKIEPDYNYLDTYASLLYKSGQMEAAETKALEAIDAGRKSGADVKGTETLLKEIQDKTGLKH